MTKETLYVIELQGGKIYIGKTRSFNHRMDQHVAGEGAAWCSRYGPQVSCSVLMEALDVTHDETKRTLEYMIEHGINNVRGAEYCQLKEFEVADAERMSYAAVHHLKRTDRAEIERKFRQSIMSESVGQPSGQGSPTGQGAISSRQSVPVSPPNRAVQQSFRHGTSNHYRSMSEQLSFKVPEESIGHDANGALPQTSIIPDETREDLVGRVEHTIGHSAVSVLLVVPDEGSALSSAPQAFVVPRQAPSNCTSSSSSSFSNSSVVFCNSMQIPHEVYRAVKIQPEISTNAKRSANQALLDGDNRELNDRLRKLRLSLAYGSGVAPYMVYTNATLDELVEKMPTNIDTLYGISGFGDKKIEKYGKCILRTINETFGNQSCTQCGSKVKTDPSKPLCLSCWRETAYY
jgi:predicted GIY-YIG superfamily endonuclease